MHRYHQSENFKSALTWQVPFMNNLHNDFKEYLNLLNANKVRYVIVGAHALAVHSVPLNTQDLDVFISNDEENVAR
jgi:hypothetical protein